MSKKQNHRNALLDKNLDKKIKSIDNNTAPKKKSNNKKDNKKLNPKQQKKEKDKVLKIGEYKHKKIPKTYMIDDRVVKELDKASRYISFLENKDVSKSEIVNRAVKKEIRKIAREYDFKIVKG